MDNLINDGSIQEPEHTQDELTPPTELPRIWSAITVPFLAIIVGAVVAAVGLVAAIMLMGIHLTPTNIESATQQLVSQPVGIRVMVLPGQIVFLAAAFVAALLSPVPFRERLQMSESRLPVWTWVVLAAGTPAIGSFLSLLMQVSGIEFSKHLELMSELLGGKSGLQLVVTAVLVGVVPGYVEEVLFRGYLQSRLLQRWSPLAAIVVSSAIFGIAHIDPMHSLLVFPIGLWLGFVAWRCGSVWPAVICHMANNLASVALVQLEIDEQNMQTAEFLLFAPCCIALIASFYLLLRTGPKEKDELLPEAPEHINTQ